MRKFQPSYGAGRGGDAAAAAMQSAGGAINVGQSLATGNVATAAATGVLDATQAGFQYATARGQAAAMGKQGADELTVGRQKLAASREAANIGLQSERERRVTEKTLLDKAIPVAIGLALLIVGASVVMGGNEDEEEGDDEEDEE